MVNDEEETADLPSPSRLKILVCSANMGNAEPNLSDIRAWIPPLGACDKVTYFDGDQHANNTNGAFDSNGQVTSSNNQSNKASDNNALQHPALSGTFDVIAIGMQESTWKNPSKGGGGGGGGGDTSTPTSKGNKQKSLKDLVQLDSLTVQTTKHDSMVLETLMEETLGDGYKMLLHQQRGQMRLILWVRAALYPSLASNLRVKCENTGLGNVLANKGGIVTTLHYQNHTRITFLTAHLAAHEGDQYYQARCGNLREILKGTRGGLLESNILDQSVTSHHMFVLGDLNFRTKFEPYKKAKSDEEKEQKHKKRVRRALELIKKQDYAGLYAFDELSEGLANKDLLVGFETLPCSFSPTFKVEREAGYVYKEQRTPSFTDRILYKSAPGLQNHFQQMAYEPCPDFITSDHKPIRGAFSIVPNATKPKPSRTRNNNKGGKRRGKKTFRVTISNMQCKDLPPMDVDGKSDPYIMAVWDGADMVKDPYRKKSKIPRNRNAGVKKWPCTSFINRTLNPNWGTRETLSMLLYENDKSIGGCNDDSFELNDVDPNAIANNVSADAMLFLAVMDYDLGNQDDLMGSLTLSVRDLVQDLKKAKTNDDSITSTTGSRFGSISMSMRASTVLRSKTITVQKPLLKYAREQGMIQCTLCIQELDSSSLSTRVATSIASSFSNKDNCCAVS